MSEIKKMKLLKKEQADEQFQRVAVLTGTEDGVPNFVAEALFGEEAVSYVLSLRGGENWNICRAGEYSCQYLTRLGFQAAASYCNLQQFLPPPNKKTAAGAVNTGGGKADTSDQTVSASIINENGGNVK